MLSAEWQLFYLSLNGLAEVDLAIDEAKDQLTSLSGNLLI